MTSNTTLSTISSTELIPVHTFHSTTTADIPALPMLEFSIISLASKRNLRRNSALSPEDHLQAITLALLQADIEGLAILTDGLFGRTRSGSSTADIIGILITPDQWPTLCRYLSTHVSDYTYTADPETLDKPVAQSQSRQRTRSLRAAANAQRNADRKELKSLILQAYMNGDLGDVRSRKAIATRDRLLSRLPEELPVLTAGRELFRMLSYWGLVSHTQYGPAPEYARPTASSTPSTDDVFQYLRADAIGKYIPQQ